MLHRCMHSCSCLIFVNQNKMQQTLTFSRKGEKFKKSEKENTRNKVGLLYKLMHYT